MAHLSLFGTDVIYYKEGQTRGDLTLDFLQSYVNAHITPIDLLRMMTVNCAKLLDVYGERGVLEVGKAADLVALTENPLENIQALRKIHFVMKDGVVYKRDGRFIWQTPRHINY